MGKITDPAVECSRVSGAGGEKSTNNRNLQNIHFYYGIIIINI